MNAFRSTTPGLLMFVNMPRHGMSSGPREITDQRAEDMSWLPLVGLCVGSHRVVYSGLLNFQP